MAPFLTRLLPMSYFLGLRFLQITFLSASSLHLLSTSTDQPTSCDFDVQSWYAQRKVNDLQSTTSRYPLRASGFIVSNMPEGKAVSTTCPINDHDSVPVTFTVFPKLPIELQLRLWKLKIPGPRVVISFRYFILLPHLREKNLVRWH